MHQAYLNAVPQMSQIADLNAIIRSLEKRLDSLEIQGSSCMSQECHTGPLGSGFMGARMKRTKVVLPPRIGPYVGEYTPNEGGNASKIFYGVYWNWLRRRFAQDISGGIKVSIITFPDQQRETRWVSRVFFNYIQNIFNDWQERDRRQGDMITNRETHDRPDRHDDDDKNGDEEDGLMSKKDRWTQDRGYDGSHTRHPIRDTVR